MENTGDTLHHINHILLSFLFVLAYQNIFLHYNHYVLEYDNIFPLMSPREQVENNDMLNGAKRTTTIHHSEGTPLVPPPPPPQHLSFQEDDIKIHHSKQSNWIKNALRVIIISFVSFLIVQYILDQRHHPSRPEPPRKIIYPTGPYQLVEKQIGKSFFDSYVFVDGPDSSGSAGYNTYVGKERAVHLGLVNVTTDPYSGEEYIYMSSAPTDEGPRESIRIEGIHRYDHGLFIIDLFHMPAGCGQWPAFWLTDDDKDQWPHHGEIDIVEGINYQNVAKTALHTSENCSMWQQVPPYTKTGQWDRAEGLFDRFNGMPQNDSILPADNCYVRTPHQWMNQGCVAVSDQNDTIGVGLNRKEGGIYVLEWDPINGYIRSWVFPRKDGIPESITASLVYPSDDQSSHSWAPDPNTDDWGIPYAYFSIGEKSDCSSDHFQHMRLIFNLAFCGTVAGPRYFIDCPMVVNQFPTNPKNQYNPIAACNEYIQSNPDELNEAYWKIKGVFVYQRT
jgi:Glycosyl hydrolases family 16